MVGSSYRLFGLILREIIGSLNQPLLMLRAVALALRTRQRRLRRLRAIFLYGADTPPWPRRGAAACTDESRFIWIALPWRRDSETGPQNQSIARNQRQVEDPSGYFAPNHRSCPKPSGQPSTLDTSPRHSVDAVARRSPNLCMHPS